MIDGQSSQRYVPAAPPSGLAFTACQVQHDRATVELTRHPCQLAAHFLPCARPPDICCPLPYRQRFHPGTHSRHLHRAFVTTRAGFDTMARRRQETDDEITEADDTAGAATFGGAPTRGPRQVTPPSVPDDLRTTLAMPTTFGPKLFEISTLHAVSTTCKVKVKDAGDLLILRDWLFEELGPPYMWTVMLSIVDWKHLTDDQKELHSTMRPDRAPRVPHSLCMFPGSIHTHRVSLAPPHPRPPRTPHTVEPGLKSS
jgi:hypothetical protein